MSSWRFSKAHEDRYKHHMHCQLVYRHMHLQCSLWAVFGGCCTPLLCKYAPHQCFRGCCTPHKNDSMQTPAFNNYYQTVIHMQVYSNQLCNSDTCGGYRLDSRLVLWNPPPAPPYFKILVRTLCTCLITTSIPPHQ